MLRLDLIQPCNSVCYFRYACFYVMHYLKVWYLPFILFWDSGSLQLLNSCDFETLFSWVSPTHVILHFSVSSFTFIMLIISYKLLLLIIIITIIIIMVIKKMFMVCFDIIFITTYVCSSVAVLSNSCIYFLLSLLSS